MDGYKASCGKCSADLLLIRSDRFLTFLPEPQRQAALEGFKTIDVDGLIVTTVDETGFHVCPVCGTPAVLSFPGADNN